MSNVDLIKLQHFFEVDNRIKKEININFPPDVNSVVNKCGIRKYVNDLEDAIIYIFSELKCVSLDIFGEKSLVFNRIVSLEKAVKNKLYSCGYDLYKLKDFYVNYIGNMTTDFVNLVKQNCIGYAFCSDRPILVANTVNEILHFIHSYVMNNDKLLKSMPELGKKQNDYNYPITLRGNESEVFNKLFEEFPSDLDVGWTDMVCINEKKLLMMVRDRGHALTIEISLNNDVAKIEYYIPKLCNIDMINALPGINKVNENSIGATGITEVDVNNLSAAIFDFISKVPTDDDMIYKEPVF